MKNTGAHGPSSASLSTAGASQSITYRTALPVHSAVGPRLWPKAYGSGDAAGRRRDSGVRSPPPRGGARRRSDRRLSTPQDSGVRPAQVVLRAVRGRMSSEESDRARWDTNERETRSARPVSRPEAPTELRG